MLARGRFSAAFAVKQWGRILRARRGAFLKGLGISIGLGLVLTLAQMIIGLPAALLIIAPAILGAFSGIYHRLVVVAYYAQVYRSAIQ
jgi:hypothetical protein